MLCQKGMFKNLAIPLTFELIEHRMPPLNVL